MANLLRLSALRSAAAFFTRRTATSRAIEASSPGQRKTRKRTAAFTLVEVTIAAGLMSVCATFGYATILSANRAAVSNRLFTLAQEIARDQVDRLQCASPFNPQITPAQVPPDLALGTNSRTTPLYIDPTANSTVVNATVTTVVTDLSNYNARAALVTVKYTFRGKNYQVQMNTIRTSDS